MATMVRGSVIGLLMAGLVVSALPASAQTVADETATESNSSILSFSGMRLDGLTTAPRSPFTNAAGIEMLQSTQGNSGVGFGLEAGFARNSFSGDDMDLAESSTGTMLGVWVGGNKDGAVGFTGEFLYVIRKTDTDAGEFEFPAIHIPAVFHINVGRGAVNDARGYAIVGPVFTINLKQKLNGVDVSENFNGADIGLLIGGGFEIVRVGVEARYNIGLRNISDEGEVGDIKNRSFEVVFKFRIN